MFRLEVNALPAESWAISGKVISESVIRPDRFRLIADYFREWRTERREAPDNHPRPRKGCSRGGGPIVTNR